MRAATRPAYGLPGRLTTQRPPGISASDWGYVLLQDVFEGLFGVFEEVQLHEDAETDDLAQLHADLIAAIVDSDPKRAAPRKRCRHCSYQ